MTDVQILYILFSKTQVPATLDFPAVKILSLNEWPVYFAVIIGCWFPAILIYCLKHKNTTGGGEWGQGMLQQRTWPPHTHQAKPAYDWFVYIRPIKTNPLTICPYLILLWLHCFLLSIPDCVYCVQAVAVVCRDQMLHCVCWLTLSKINIFVWFWYVKYLVIILTFKFTTHACQYIQQYTVTIYKRQQDYK